MALGGAGYAATALPRNSVGPLQIKSDAVTSVDVKDRSLSSRDFKTGQIPQGPAGPAGPAGPLLSTLPAGQSLTGAFALGGKATAPGELAMTAISFQFKLPARAQVTVVASGGSPTATCPGTVESPASTPGNLCVYEGYRESNPSAVLAFDPVDGSSGSSLHGATLFTFSTQTGSFDVSGSWSVTA